MTDADRGKLKLFVIGESTGNPSEWSEYGRRILVMAKDTEQASGLCGEGCSGQPVAEVSPEEPCVLYVELCDPPDW